MATVYEFLADGFEDIEALAPVDVLRRGGVDIQTVSTTGSRTVTSAHGVALQADLTIEEADLSQATLLLLPGGMPGAQNLLEHEGVTSALLAHARQGRLIGAICAAPMVLGHLGLLRGRRATCYPGFESHLTGAEYTAQLVTVDGPFITAEGPAASLEYAYTLLTILRDVQTTLPIRRGMMYDHLMQARHD